MQVPQGAGRGPGTLQGPMKTCGMASGEEDEGFWGRGYFRRAGVGMPYLKSWE